MSYNISLDALKAMYFQETGDYPIVLLTISHSGISDDILLSTDATSRIISLTNDYQVVYGTSSNGKDYLYYPMSINMPEDDEGAPPRTSITIDNIHQELTEHIRTIETSPTVKMDIVMFSDPDNVQMSFEGFEFTHVDINELQITGEMSLDILVNEPYPKDSFTPAYAKGLFTS